MGAARPEPDGSMVHGHRIGRREFLARAAAAGLAASVAGVGTGCGGAREFGWRLHELAEPGARLTPGAWETLAAAQDRLLPSGPDSPGARDVNAIGYLDAAMVDVIKPADREVVLLGSARLNELAERRGVADYAALSDNDRAAVLHVLHDETDGDFTSVVLRHTLDALLGDPVYGVNTGEAGWNWLGIRPRQPRPPEPARMRSR